MAVRGSVLQGVGGLVWGAAALSLVVILHVPVVAELFGVVPPGGAQVSTAIALGVAAVGWRLMLRRRGGSERN